MSEQDVTGPPQPSDYQQAAAQQGQAVPYGQAAAQAVGQVIDPEAAGENADAGPTIEQIQQSQREALLPFEKQLADMMASFESQRDSMAQQIEQLQRQLQTTQAQVGPAAVTLYADSAYNRAQSLASANPDVGAAHFAPLIEAAGKLSAAAKDVAGGESEPGLLDELSAPVRAWIANHRGKHLEGLGTLTHDLEHLDAENAKLKAA